LCNCAVEEECCVEQFDTATHVSVCDKKDTSDKNFGIVRLID